MVAKILPWVELFIGLFVVLGLWLDISLRAALILFMGFILVVGQALIRHLPLTECGCFGGLISLPPYVVFMMDSCALCLTGLLILKKDQSHGFSLDRYFEKDNK